MSVCAITNITNYSKSSAQNFKAEPDVLQKLDDDTLYELASLAPKKRISDVSRNTLNTFLVGIPLADSFLAGAVKSGQLSSKISASASSLGKWGRLFAAGAAVLGMKHVINSRFEKLDNFDKKNKGTGFVIDIAALYGAISAADLLWTAGKDRFAKTFPKFTETLKDKVKLPLKEVLNNSLLNNKVVKPVGKYAAKHPYFKGAAIGLAVCAAPVAAIAALLRTDKEIAAASKEFDNNYFFLNAMNSLIPDVQAENSEE